jgi:hypothetical protein
MMPLLLLLQLLSALHQWQVRQWLQVQGRVVPLLSQQTQQQHQLKRHQQQRQQQQQQFKSSCSGRRSAAGPVRLTRLLLQQRQQHWQGELTQQLLLQLVRLQGQLCLR